MDCVNSSQQRKHLPTSCSERQGSNGSSLSYLPTPLFSVLCHLAITHEPRGSEGRPPARSPGFTGCRAGSGRQTQALEAPSLPSPWTSSRQRQLRGLCEICCFSELPSSFLNSRYCAPVAGGRGIPNRVFLLHHVSCKQKHEKRAKTTPGPCGTTTGLQVCAKPGCSDNL